MRTLLISFLNMLLINVSFSQDHLKLTLADRAFDNKEYQSALKLYESIVEDAGLKQYYHFTMYKKAYCNYMLTQYNEAISDVKQALKVKKTDTQYPWLMGNGYWLYARIYSKLNMKKEALKCLTKASEFIVTSTLYSTIGYAEIQNGLYEKAVKSLDKSVELDAFNAYAYSNRALAYFKLSVFDKARTDINKSIDLNDKNPYAFKHSAMIYIAMNDMENACIELKKAEANGYATFGNETDAHEVDEMIKKYCSVPAN
jgi:tetratricopeptide (TPR) repeat protein